MSFCQKQKQKLILKAKRLDGLDLHTAPTSQNDPAEGQGQKQTQLKSGSSDAAIQT